MNRVPPPASAPVPKSFGQCACGRSLYPTEGSQCEVCLRAKHYLAGDNPEGPASEPTPTYGRPT
jgi:hypothetical protein